jgi:hypothetical protein
MKPKANNIYLRLIVASRHISRIHWILCLAAPPFLASAQTTIGSGGPAARGALLELKTMEPASPANLTDNANVTSASGGLLLPRVKLTNPLTLDPLIPDADPDWLDAGVTKIKERHVGLTVYNLTSSKDFKPGVYSWNGSRWSPVIFTTLRPGNGVTLTGDTFKLGGQLIKPAIVRQGDFTTRISGPDSLLMSAPATLSGPLRFVDGNERAGYVLMSDAEGNAGWEDPQILPPTPLATITDNSSVYKFTDINNGKWRETGAYVILPQGRWFVAVTMHAKLGGGGLDRTGNYNDWIWLRSSFFAEGESQLDKSYFEGPGCYVSGRLSNGSSIINGHLVIKHDSPAPVKFRYMMGAAEAGAGILSDVSKIEVSEFASSKHKASSIVVFALAE